MTDQYDSREHGNRLAFNQTWWKRKRREYVAEFGAVYCAKAQIGPPEARPERVEHLCSAALFVRGERFYMFKSEADRDAFVERCPGAEVCEDPL